MYRLELRDDESIHIAASPLLQALTNREIVERWNEGVPTITAIEEVLRLAVKAEIDSLNPDDTNTLYLHSLGLRESGAVGIALTYKMVSGRPVVVRYATDGGPLE